MAKTTDSNWPHPPGEPKHHGSTSTRLLRSIAVKHKLRSPSPQISSLGRDQSTSALGCDSCSVHGAGGQINLQTIVYQQAFERWLAPSKSLRRIGRTPTTASSSDKASHCHDREDSSVGIVKRPEMEQVFAACRCKPLGRHRPSLPRRAPSKRIGTSNENR